MADRLDKVLVERGLFATRAKAQQAIQDGIVWVDGSACTKAGRKVAPDADIQLVGRALPYVSRGGLKLERALEAFGIELAGRCVLDIGSSTGGFTDCALQHGAARVVAVDVGTDQMAEPVRSDPRVSLHEQTDFRTMDAALLAGVDIATIDVSFTSATLMVPRLAETATVRDVICLIKPQFECGAQAAKAHRGVIVDPALHAQAREKVTSAFEHGGFTCRGITESPITGGDGNVEYLAHFAR
ncbi:MAG: TlyA family RNA methyltransferase [Coriobacteriaceae bacterium]|nr:TlyA family RNA methyltransferase [Coriobacteriaceae bacterium]